MSTSFLSDGSDDPTWVYREAMKAAIVQGNLEAIGDLLIKGRPKRGLGGEVVRLAIESGRDDIAELVCGGSEPAGVWSAAKALFKKGDVPGMVMFCDFTDGPMTVNNLLRWAVTGGDVARLTPLLKDFTVRSYWPGLLENALPLAANMGQWDMFRFLVNLTPLDTVSAHASELLLIMAQSTQVPHDLLESALTWEIVGEPKGAVLGEVFIMAAQRGQSDLVGLLIQEAGMVDDNGVKAVIEAVTCDRLAVMSLLVPLVDVQTLSTQFSQRMSETLWGNDVAKEREVLRAGMDRVSRYLSSDDLAIWVHCFSHEAIPMNKALLRDRYLRISQPPLIHVQATPDGCLVSKPDDASLLLLSCFNP